MSSTEPGFPGAVLLTGEEVIGLFGEASAAYTRESEARSQEWYLGFQTMRTERFYYEEVYVALTALHLLAQRQAYVECQGQHAQYWRWVPVVGHRKEQDIIARCIMRQQQLYLAACKAAGLPPELTSWDKPQRWPTSIRPKDALCSTLWVRARVFLAAARAEPTRQFMVPLEMLELLVVEEGA